MGGRQRAARQAWCHLAAALVVAAAACGRTPPETPDPGPIPGEGERITGTERIGWQQVAADAEEAARLRYAAYVDNVRRDLPDASCDSSPAPAGFACTARLPPMAAGRHTIELVSFVDEGTRLESPRSAPLVVIVVAAPATAPGGDASPRSITTADGVRLRADVIANSLEEPTDLAPAPDGRIYIAERTGRIRLVRDGGLVERPALVLGDVSADGTGGLLAIAVAPDFVRSGHVYAAYTASTASPPPLHVARFRAVGDTLGDRVILMDAGPLSGTPTATLRFGPDGKLYVGLDDGGNPANADDLGSLLGKILRLNADGTTPSDQASGWPVFASRLFAPRAVDWNRWEADAPLWVIDGGGGAGDTLQAVVSESPTAQRGRTLFRYAFPRDAGANGLAVYRADLIPELRGDFLVASATGGALLRLRFDPDDRRRLVGSERLLQDAFGPLRAVAVAADGTIVVASAAAVVRIAPE